MTIFKMFEEIKNVLKSVLIEIDGKQVPKYFSDNDELLRTKVDEDARKYDPTLIERLLKNSKCAEQFFETVKTEDSSITIFLKDKFCDVINCHEFLPNSFTKFENKIGLTSGDTFLSRNDEVVLSFPHKDCVLEGGQTKEDQKRNEIFYNKILASDEISNMLAPKCFVNAKKYDKANIDGQSIDKFESSDNLIIKGNNLIALSSLLNKYEGQVKCIYIDPPYNTGKVNSFGYNDSFNHSSWLTFMRNRLMLAKKLLAPDGTLLVQTDDKEQAYLKVLCDEIFGTEQFESSFFVQVRFTNKTLAEDSALHKVVETIHVYSKNHNLFSINKIKQEYSIEKFCWKITETGEYETIKVGGKTVDIFKDGTYTIEQVAPDYGCLKETWATGSLIRQGGTAAEFLAKYLINRKKEDGLKVLYKVHNMGEDGLGYRYILGPQKQSAFRGKFYSGIPTSILESVKTGEYSKETPVPNLLYNFLSFEGEFGNCRTEGGVDIGGGKKPEQLIKFLLDYFSNKGDLVMDFFAGSGSTLATAHKYNRMYIGVEQLDYGDNDPKHRLINVINGDTTGISKEPDVNWQGGGSFVYCELAKNNQVWIDKIDNANDSHELDILYNQIQNLNTLNTQVSSSILKDKEEFLKLSLDDKKKVLVDLLDMNQLYFNYADIEDTDTKISDSDKAFTKSFYGDAE